MASISLTTVCSTCAVQLMERTKKLCMDKATWDANILDSCFSAFTSRSSCEDLEGGKLCTLRPTDHDCLGCKSMGLWGTPFSRWSDSGISCWHTTCIWDWITQNCCGWLWISATYGIIGGLGMSSHVVQMVDAGTHHTFHTIWQHGSTYPFQSHENIFLKKRNHCKRVCTRFGECSLSPDIVQHIPGFTNITCDALSRLPSGKYSVPGHLTNIPRARLSIRDRNWWKSLTPPQISSA